MYTLGNQSYFCSLFTQWCILQSQRTLKIMEQLRLLSFYNTHFDQYFSSMTLTLVTSIISRVCLLVCATLYSQQLTVQLVIFPMISEVLTAISIQITVFCNVAMCSSADKYKHLTGNFYPENGVSMFPEISSYLPNCMTSHFQFNSVCTC